MKTNDLKKGARVLLDNGWEADIMDNRKGVRRCMKVYGDYTEMGDVWSHQIVAYKFANWREIDCPWLTDIEYTKDQLKCKEMNSFM